MQLFPWLETTLRYTDVRPGSTAASKRSLAIKRIKIKPRSQTAFVGRELLAAASGGWSRDIGGTGLFDAEYLVASKAGGRSILRSAWAGDIWAPAVIEKSALFSQ